MPLIRPCDAAVFKLPGVTFTGLAAPSRGSVENSVWTVLVEPGTAGAPHRVTREETFVALSGTAVAKVNGVAHEIAAGDALVVPADAVLSLDNPAAEPFRAVAVLPVGGQVVTDNAPPFTPPWAA